MTVTETKLKDCFVLEPQVFGDKRGYFLESYNAETFNKLTGLNVTFVQDNESFSSRGVLRGLHYQLGEHAQAKLVRVVKGEVLDVAVDIRIGSPTFGQHVAVKLTEENKKQLFVPRGFAHGFVVLSETAIFSYKCDNFYNKASEGGIIYNDKTIDIDWKINESEMLISEKDIILPSLENASL
ncbi:dTDP-4-dehydrorhamnose 3,5-epimerase [Formosa algae]|uniref:dTDP-4-dehydrorhamnose 3,5-epimerase n=1 Tax=Formosa algae TaxID=225843 RepID=A0A9X1C848_9FLAO|nr:dTDP-4-dehydrorhamnose 3,5-epimerase [Formosa algae]MBP1838696.1 dTDP-4-dehydrorhamnose 3,5-epimerase [Formosa algae]MDQ0335196.1 dTDP-4-dehydrorhamnose 3,5-epimerase [Formosa algae]OEI81631.1 dTDP-4-dehydrorhamnose 3,5-epimerase [Formosa algae]PNW26701.1 dTDP-4-dehydrorhamnose 3,5-epimerase [Formosa algae]